MPQIESREAAEAPGRERRVIASAGLRVERRAGQADDAQPSRVVGHAAVFDVWTTLYESRFYLWREVVRPGAFARAIAEKQDCRSLFNHDPNYVLGRTASGTLSLSEDETGLLTDTDAPDTQLIRDMVLAPIGRGDITQMSFAFVPNRAGKQVITNDGPVTVIDCGGERITVRTEGDQTVEERELLDLDLFDVSPVTYPAYEETDVALRSLAEKREQSIQGAKAARRSFRLKAMRLRQLRAQLQACENR